MTDVDDILKLLSIAEKAHKFGAPLMPLHDEAMVRLHELAAEAAKRLDAARKAKAEKEAADREAAAQKAADEAAATEKANKEADAKKASIVKPTPKKVDVPDYPVPPATGDYSKYDNIPPESTVTTVRSVED